MNLRVQRAFRLFVAPLLSFGALTSVGYSLWLFALPEATLANEEQALGNLDVSGVSTTPLDLEILPPEGYDGYRIVFDQGGIGSRFDEEVGVGLSTGQISCRLSSLYFPLDPNFLLIDFELSCSCACFDSIQFKKHAESSLLQSITYTVSEASTAWEEASVAEIGYAHSYTFFLSPEFRWRTGMKPTESESWAEFMNSRNGCGANHYLTVHVENVVE